jgi:hypothetical protein
MTHLALRDRSAATLVPNAPQGRLVTCVPISRVLASKGSNLPPSGQALFLLRYCLKISPHIIEIKSKSYFGYVTA